MSRTATHLHSFCFLLAILLFSLNLVAQKGFFPAFPAKNPDIEYPKDLTPPLPEATVTLDAGINSEGKVDSVVILRPATPELTEAATQAIASWKFVPAKQDGTPV